MHNRRAMHAITHFATTTIQRAVICALISFAALPAQAANPNAQQLAAYEITPELQRVKLLMFLAKSLEAEQVTYLLRRYPLVGPHAANRTLFLEGLVLKARGRYTQAVKKFRAALADDPTLTLVRTELAETLVMLEQDDSAMHHLRLLAADAPDEKTASGIRSFIDQIDERKTYTVSGYFSLAPTTNINSGSKHTTVYSQIQNANVPLTQPESGVGAAAGVNYGNSKRLGNDMILVGAFGADVRVYEDPGFNNYGFSQSADLRYLLEKGYFGLGVIASQQLDNQTYEPSYFSYGPRISASIQANNKNHLFASFSTEWRNYIDAASEDAVAYSANANWTHAWNSTMNATLILGFDRMDTNNKASSYNSYTFGASLYRELPMGITANLLGQLSKSNYDGFNLAASKTRQDARASASLTLTKRDLNFHGFAPSATYSFVNNWSNVESFDYVSHSFDFRLTKDF